MNLLMMIHLTGGTLALASGAVAVAARKGGPLHAQAGTWFLSSMLLLGITAAFLEPQRDPPGSPIGGIMVCYFVLTAWYAARRRDGTTGWVELSAAVAALGMAGLMIWGGLVGESTPAGTGPIYLLAAVLLIAGAGDLAALFRRKLRPAQRLTRHLWRMCFAFFIATGSFFLGQQDVLPAAVRGSPILFALALAPFAVMGFWLVRLRFAKSIPRLSLRIPAAAGALDPAQSPRGTPS